jgi:hypothetical protein
MEKDWFLFYHDLGLCCNLWGYFWQVEIIFQREITAYCRCNCKFVKFCRGFIQTEEFKGMLFLVVILMEWLYFLAGCERFSNYEGYSKTFKWAGNCEDTTPRDSSGRRMCSVVAIDALHLRNSNVQYAPNNLLRELNKVQVRQRL